MTCLLLLSIRTRNRKLAFKGAVYNGPLLAHKAKLVNNWLSYNVSYIDVSLSALGVYNSVEISIVFHHRYWYSTHSGMTRWLTFWHMAGRTAATPLHN